jgi:protoheme IX farnesyltransferase
MLPSVVPLAEAVRQMIGYTVVLVAVTLVLIPVGGFGWIYGVSAVVLGAIFLGSTIWLARNPTPSASMRVFGFSITYVTMLFAAMMVDVFIDHGVS